MLRREMISQEEFDRMVRYIGIPQRYAGCTFENYQPRANPDKPMEAAIEWADAPLTDRGLFLMGEPGSGKTHLMAAALSRRLWRDGTPGMRFVNVPMFLDTIRDAQKYTDSRAVDLYQFCRDEASVVVLDDFGKERATDWAAERLYVLIESRYGKMLPTLVTSNRTLDELEDDGYGAAVSRLQHTCRVIRSKAPDFRPDLGRAGI